RPVDSLILYRRSKVLHCSIGSLLNIIRINAVPCCSLRNELEQAGSPKLTVHGLRVIAGFLLCQGECKFLRHTITLCGCGHSIEDSLILWELALNTTASNSPATTSSLTRSPTRHSRGCPYVGK